MGNKSREQRAVKQAPLPHIPSEDRLATVELYLEHANSNTVGEILGISGAAVRDRLYALNVPLRPQGFSDVAHDWEEAVERRLRELRRTCP